MLDYNQLFEQIETCQDWYDFLDNPNYDSIDFGYAISDRFWNENIPPYTYIGNIGGDWEWVAPKDGKVPNNCTLASEIGKVNEFGYHKSYDKYPIDDLLQKMIDLLQVTNVTANVNYQTPNNITRLHFDIMTSFLKEHEDLSQVPFDRKTLQPVGMKPLRRFFVALNDWEDGHVFQMGTKQWSGWKKGDVIDFHWRGVPHSTANTGFIDRASLKVSGFSDIEYIGNVTL